MKLLLTILLFLPLVAQSGVLTIEDHNTVVMNTEFDSTSVANVSAELVDKCKTRKSLYLFLDTPGGSVIDGLNLIYIVKALPCRVHTITLFAASMGYITAQMLGKRYILPGGILMSHRGSLRLSGDFPGSFNEKLRFFTEMTRQVDVRVAKRVGITLKDYRKQILHDLWMTADTAIRTNHADRKILVRCGKSLEGTVQETVNTMFGKVKVTRHKCPLITGILDMEFDRVEAQREALHKLNKKSRLLHGQAK